MFSLLLFLFPLLLFSSRTAMHDFALAEMPAMPSTVEELQSGRTQRRAAAISPLLVLLIPCAEYFYIFQSSVRDFSTNVYAI